MCGIAGVAHPSGGEVPDLAHRLAVMNHLQRHRGPDGEGAWQHPRQHVGLAHRRLSIIDLTDRGAQPMRDAAGNHLTFNGEIYNYLELREELGPENFASETDSEVILHAYRRWGEDCVSHLRGMFAFAIWDEQKQQLFCARDRFGIKPFYYTVVDGAVYFASEVKALLPFVHKIETDVESLNEYLVFQLCLHGKTLFKNIFEVQPGHVLQVGAGRVQTRRYWQVYYDLDFDHTEKYFAEHLQQLFLDSVDVHCRADVPLGGYISGGVDSSLIACLATRAGTDGFEGFTGKFSISRHYDESPYAEDVARQQKFDLYQTDISVDDFVEHLERVLYHLDYPVAGPGAFPQYMVSRLASTRRKLVLGGQGGDEIFGGYVRYLIAYFEQCIKAAIDGTMQNGNFVVTYESIIPNLESMRQYKPLLQSFWREGLFDDLDRRYFRLINRAPALGDEIRWDLLRGHDAFESFRRVFRADNVSKESYFDSMTHFDFKTLLPALLHVEDRMSMAHGLESRVPFLDHPLVEFAATMPSNVKFKDGQLKYLLRTAMKEHLPDSILQRKDKMGFPVPLAEWFQGGARSFIIDTLSTAKALQRDFVDNRKVVEGLAGEGQFGRKVWGLLSLEIWQQQFHDRQHEFKELLQNKASPARQAA